MKKFYNILFLFIYLNIHAQSITLTSNGYASTFNKVDTLFFNEYAGFKTKIKLASSDSSFSNSLIQFDSSFGVVTKSTTETNAANTKLVSTQRILSTPFYLNTDGTFEAPTSTLFLKPNNVSSIVNDFSEYGSIVAHPEFKGFYFLHLNTKIYNTGDKVIELCNLLNQQGLALIVEPVFVRLIKLQDDPLFSNEWNIKNTGQYGGTLGADMHVADTWCLGYNGEGIKVAVLDVGVDLNHPDLKGNLLPGYDATGGNSAGGSLEGNSHGTNCAGIIAEISNTIGGKGIAYMSKIIPVRIGLAFSSGYILTNDTWIINSFNYAVNQHADILSNSWGYGSSSSQLDQAIQNAVQNGRSGKGSVVLFGVGNNNDAVLYPATNSNVIAVGASCECDTRKRSSNNNSILPQGVKADTKGVSCDGEELWGSNYGTSLDIVAPGVWITTTTNGTSGNYSNAYINNFGGTSAACPNAAAVLALILSVNPNLTGQVARNILESSCEKVGGYTYQTNVVGQPNGTWSTDAGYGRVDAFNAVAKSIATITNINGADNFCSSSTYTITPTKGLIVSGWTVAPSGIVTITPNGNSVTLKQISNGTVTLNAILNSQCRSGVVISKEVIAGIPVPYIQTPVYFGNEVALTALYISNATYNWYEGGVLMESGADNHYSTTVACNASKFIQVEAVNACGKSIKTGKGVDVNCSGGGQFIVTPNPATDNVSISTNNNKTQQDKNEIDEIKIYDLQGNLKKYQKYSKAKQANINIAELKNGSYFIEITNGSYKEKHQLRIQK